MNLVAVYLLLNSGLPSTVYGMGERMCGEKQTQVCDSTSITASGVPFNPLFPTAAIAIPANYRIREQTIFLRVEDGPCKKIFLTDKMNARYIGNRGFDLTPGALIALGEVPVSHWSKRVFVCKGEV